MVELLKAAGQGRTKQANLAYFRRNRFNVHLNKFYELLERLNNEVCHRHSR
jgi:hypothetical protein